jgi:hypothetical protein
VGRHEDSSFSCGLIDCVADRYRQTVAARSMLLAAPDWAERSANHP